MDVNLKYQETIKPIYLSKYTGSLDPAVNSKYILSKSEMQRQKLKVDAKTKEFVSANITKEMSDLDKEIAIHDYLVKNAEYNVEELNDFLSVNHNPYGVLINGKGVCDSYAKAFYVLAKASDLEVMYVTGLANNGNGSENHAWNMVKLDDGWYNIDVTWDDPVISGGSKKDDYVRYTYFNLSDEKMNKTHKRDEKVIKYPKANGSKYLGETLLKEGRIKNLN